MPHKGKHREDISQGLPNDPITTMSYRGESFGLDRLQTHLQRRRPRSLNAFATTDTELKLIAVAAIIGLRRIPKNG